MGRDEGDVTVVRLAAMCAGKVLTITPTIMTQARYGVMINADCARHGYGMSCTCGRVLMASELM